MISNSLNWAPFQWTHSCLLCYDLSTYRLWMFPVELEISFFKNWFIRVLSEENNFFCNLNCKYSFQTILYLFCFVWGGVLHSKSFYTCGINLISLFPVVVMLEDHWFICYFEIAISLKQDWSSGTPWHAHLVFIAREEEVMWRKGKWGVDTMISYSRHLSHLNTVVQLLIGWHSLLQE